MRIFNILKFERQEINRVSGHLERTVFLQACVPGVNSGAYDKALHISVHQTRPFKFWPWLKWKFGREEYMCASINLDEDEMTQLRDEINKILRLPFKETSS